MFNTKRTSLHLPFCLIKGLDVFSFRNSACIYCQGSHKRLQQCWPTHSLKRFCGSWEEPFQRRIWTWLTLLYDRCMCFGCLCHQSENVCWRFSLRLLQLKQPEAVTMECFFSFAMSELASKSVRPSEGLIVSSSVLWWPTAKEYQE